MAHNIPFTQAHDDFVSQNHPYLIHALIRRAFSYRGRSKTTLDIVFGEATFTLPNPFIYHDIITASADGVVVGLFPVVAPGLSRWIQTFDRLW